MSLHTNRLINEKSPYLLQHAHNPVDWFPWGEEAFLRARAENKPIILSIGYSTCHWCHVMAHESFENEKVAKIINDHFVPVKVDREERPDLDRVYMTFVQATTGSGGWPMTVWLTPDLKPFAGGTYYPPEDRWGRPGLFSVLLKISEVWEQNRMDIVASADEIIRQLQQSAGYGTEAGSTVNTSMLETCYEQIKSSYEPQYGGFGGAPKFPRPVTLNFLLRHYARTGVEDALTMSLFTLRKMADGGMHDHLGGGFHRYSVDASWHVPHFEKMLYDQAQLACSYLDAWQITRDRFFADVARDILDYVLRDMTGKEGQFHAAEDADSPLPDNSDGGHAEGAFYVWEHREIVDALDKPDAEVFNYYYGVEPGGNVRSDPQGEFQNKNILIVRHTVEETAAKFGMTTDAIDGALTKARSGLYALRNSRPRPHLDDKAIAAWNGLMISAFARAYQVLDDPRYLSAARKAASFIENRMVHNDTGRLLRRYRAGEAAIGAFADDYASLVQGLLDLYEASFETRWLTWAVSLQKIQDELFRDRTGGGYFNSDNGDRSVLLRMKEDYDGAEPSANSVSALNLLRLSEITGDDNYRTCADELFASMSTRLQSVPSAVPQMLVAVNFLLGKPRQIIIAGTPGNADTRELLKEVHSHFLPNAILLFADGGSGQETLALYNDFLKTIHTIDGKATAYVCRDYRCDLPTGTVEELRKVLETK
jgi:uncharacterized protein